MNRSYKKKTVSRPEQTGCLCCYEDLPEGVSHVCSLFTQIRPITTDHLKWRAGSGGKVPKNRTWTDSHLFVGRFRHVENESGKLVAEIDHGDHWPTTPEDWVECYEGHKLCSVLLPPLDISSSLDFAEPWKGKGVGLVPGVRSNGLFCVVSHTQEAAKIFHNFFPPTQRIHGRSDSPKRYFWYMKPEMPPTTIFKDASGKVLVEIRSEGCDPTLVPPSIHALGEQLQWQTQFPVKNPPCWPFESFEQSANYTAACITISQAWPEDDSQADWVDGLIHCLIKRGVTPDFVAHFVASAAVTSTEDQWHQIYTAVHEQALECLTSNNCHGEDLAELLGKDSARLVANWLNITPTNATAESDLESTWEADFPYCDDLLAECTSDHEEFSLST
ncbi:MAG: hypothetical protein LC687_04270 [Actinobacteria bacterium]|nr:hypothetical protein [Actinomycetota bacterium]